MIYLPRGVISPITEGLSIGGLLAYADPDALRFELVLNVAWELTDGHCQVEPLSNGTTVHNARLDDSEEVEEQSTEIQRAVAMVTAARARGKKVLVTCAQGRNRSALVIAEHLIQMGGDPNEVIALIQAARQRALTNDAFVAWLRRPRSQKRFICEMCGTKLGEKMGISLPQDMIARIELEDEMVEDPTCLRFCGKRCHGRWGALKQGTIWQEHGNGCMCAACFT